MGVFFFFFTMILKFEHLFNFLARSRQSNLPFHHFLAATFPQNCEQDQALASSRISSIFKSHNNIFFI